MSASREERTLEVAAEIGELLAQRGAPTAVIGAVALAVRGYPRATVDLDLATDADPASVLEPTQRELAARGYDAELCLPDADDPLGGVLTVRGADSDPVQVVNFRNPFRPGSGAVGREAITHAEPAALGRLAVVDLPHLIALKLYAGGVKSRADVAELLERNPGLEIDVLRATCRGVGLEPELEALLQELGR